MKGRCVPTLADIMSGTPDGQILSTLRACLPTNKLNESSFIKIKEIGLRDSNNKGDGGSGRRRAPYLFTRR